MSGMINRQEGQNRSRGPAGGRGQPVQHGKDRSPTFRFANMDVAVIAERSDDGERLIRELQRARVRVQHIWPVPPQLPVDFDVIYCELTEDLPSRLPWVPGEPEAALVLVATGKVPVDYGLVRNCATQSILHYPLQPASVQSSLFLAREHFLYERRLRGRIDRLDENLRTMRSVERAKAIVMRMKNMNEEEAYHFLRRQAMERRVSIGSVANALIDSQEILG
ncbi:MAG: ANTAR domain-containing protein [Alphaproteobacteria bacterium]|nr:ANTAR domain-containing protein [Alphaproteobacteria bacterium]